MLGSVILMVSMFLISTNAQDCATMPKMGPHECCPGFMPSGMTPAIMTECGLPGPDAVPTGMPPCDVSICLLKKINILTPDNKIVDKAAFTAALESQYPADFKPLVAPSYDACINEQNKTPCGQQAFILCIKSQMLKNCPASVAVTNPDCTATKAFFDKCVAKTT